MLQEPAEGRFALGGVDGGAAEFDAELGQFADDAEEAPGGVLGLHLEDQLLGFAFDGLAADVGRFLPGGFLGEPAAISLGGDDFQAAFDLVAELAAQGDKLLPLLGVGYDGLGIQPALEHFDLVGHENQLVGLALLKEAEKKEQHGENALPHGGFSRSLKFR